MRTSPILTSFSGGEASPRLYGRLDLNKYFNSCRTMENIIVHPHGGASRRPGTYFVVEVKDSTKTVRLIPFVFSTTQAYILEFGDEYMRVYKDGGQVESPPGTPCEISTPYTESQLSAIKYVQSADTMYLVHPDVPPQKLTRTSHTAWTLTAVTFTAGPWTSGTGYPSAVAFYEQRLVFAGAPEYPQTIWGSKSGDYEDFTQGTSDDDAWTYAIAADQVNVIRWLMHARYLLCGTVGGEWVMSSGSDDSPITPTAVKVRRELTTGSYNLDPVMIGDVVIFLQRAGRKLRELSYQYVNDNYVAPDLTIFAEHITESGIVAWAYQPEPDSVLWCVRADGALIGFTYDRGQQVLAWHRQPTRGLVESVAVIPETTHDQLWLVVKRTIGGTDKRFIEYMMPDFGTDLKNAFFVDCGLTREDDGAPVSSVSGLHHLEGETVQILADGAVRPAQTVVSGAISIDPPARTIHAGLGYTSVLEPMRLDAGAQSGTSQGKKKRINALTVRFYRTVGAKIGSAEGTLDTIPFRTPSDRMDSAVALFSGDKEVPFPGGWDTNGFIRITQDQPLPMTVLAIMPVVNTSD